MSYHINNLITHLLVLDKKTNKYLMYSKLMLYGKYIIDNNQKSIYKYLNYIIAQNLRNIKLKICNSHYSLFIKTKSKHNKIIEKSKKYQT